MFASLLPEPSPWARRQESPDAEATMTPGGRAGPDPPSVPRPQAFPNFLRKHRAGGSKYPLTGQEESCISVQP